MMRDDRPIESSTSISLCCVTSGEVNTYRKIVSVLRKYKQPPKRKFNTGYVTGNHYS